MCIYLWPEFDCPGVTLFGWQDIKILHFIIMTVKMFFLNIYLYIYMGSLKYTFDLEAGESFRSDGLLAQTIV